jgi:hypothetical protein
MKYLRSYLACRKTSQKRVVQSDTVQQQSVGANGLRAGTIMPLAGLIQRRTPKRYGWRRSQRAESTSRRTRELQPFYGEVWTKSEGVQLEPVPVPESFAPVFRSDNPGHDPVLWIHPGSRGEAPPLN